MVVSETKAKKEKKEKTEAGWKQRLKDGVPNFDYYQLVFKLTNECLGTGTAASIYDKHVLKRAQKQISEANKMSVKVTKALAKFQTEQISEGKEIAEVKGLIIRFKELIGQQITDLPDDIDALIAIAEQVEEDYRNLIGDDIAGTTVFMRQVDPSDPTGKTTFPYISSHVVLGNMKAIVEVLMATQDKTEKGVLPYSNQIGKVFSMDVKPIEFFMYPDNDIMRNEDGSPLMCERPVRFIDKKTFKETSAINRSEQLPIGTKFGCTLRVRKGSPIGEDEIRYILDFGKNLGLGAWRGSGLKGTYLTKLIPLPDYREPVDPEGFV